MKKTTLLIVFSIILSLTFAQNIDTVLLTINDKEITLGEFERIYKKNSNIKGNEFDEKSVEEYLELFINFKLKVIEAESLGYDTVSSFIKELRGYRRQLEKPYLTDPNVDERLVEEAYERMKYDVKAAHILFKLDENAIDDDTLKVYNSAIQVREKIIEGLDFNEAAVQYSEDPSAITNKGHLGYFTAFQMVYPFESAAFNTPAGEVSMPVRSKFGYHLIKVYDKREAIGQVKVAHIMLSTPKTTDEAKKKDAETKAMAVYDSIMAGADFAEMAKRHSDDKGSAKQGGALPIFGTGRMVPEFEKACFEIQNINDVSKPIKTNFGWHIIKLLEKENIGTFEEKKDMLSNKINRDNRKKYSRSQLIRKLKKEYNYKFYRENLNDLISKLDNRFLKDDEWVDHNKENLTKTIFSLLDTQFTQYDIADFLKKKFKKHRDQSFKNYVNWALRGISEELIIKFERERLEEKYPDFRYLIKEYHDGILLFELTDKVVWSKAVQDTVGLENYYKNNAEKYKWDERYEGIIYTCKDAKTLKKTKKLITKGLSTEEILTAINKKDDSCLKTETAKFSKGDNEIIDFKIWDLGNEDSIKEQLNVTELTGKTIPSEPKLLEEAKGLITADYQTYLEEQWINELKSKYTININKVVLKLIK